MFIYFLDKSQKLIKMISEGGIVEAIQTLELPDENTLMKDTLAGSVKAEFVTALETAEYMAVKSYEGNEQAFDMYRVIDDSLNGNVLSFTGMQLGAFELDGVIIQDIRPSGKNTLTATINQILAGSGWRLGYIDTTLKDISTTFYYVSAKEALKVVQNLANAEIMFKVEISGSKVTDKWIEVYSKVGKATKKRFNYGSNALTVVRETNKAEIYTALIGRGKGEQVSENGYGRRITFENVEWTTASGKPLNKPLGQFYLEDPNATANFGVKQANGTMKPRIGVVDFDDETDPATLLQRTYEQLQVTARPQVLFKTTVANIGATGIGDTVTIHRHDLNIHYQTRVRKIVRDKLNDNRTQIELGDEVVTPSTKQQKNIVSSVKSLTQTVAKNETDISYTIASADGKNSNTYGSVEPEQKRTGDLWYRPNAEDPTEVDMLIWNGSAWELLVDTNAVNQAIENAQADADQATQDANDADLKAEAIKQGLGIASTTLTNQQITEQIKLDYDATKSAAGTALADAKSAMDEAKLADVKIANYVTTNGLVSGTTVDSKIDTATGEISRKITTVESKVDNIKVGGRNYWVIAESSEGYSRTWASGTLYATTNAIASGLIPTEPNEQFTLNYRNYSSQTMYYNKSKEYIGSFEGLRMVTPDSGAGYSFTNNSGRPTDDTPAYVSYTFRSNFLEENPNYKIMLEKGNTATDWTPAPEDNLSQSEFQIFENTYNEDVKGINSTLTELTNKKLDGTTYQNFYNNEYKQTAQGVTDAWTAVNKIIDANGNSTDTFAKAVYDRNATRQSADFKSVTDGLVKTATYEDGIDGVKQSITSVRGDLDNLSARNYFIRKEENVNKLYVWSNGVVSNENGSITSDLIDVKEGDVFSSNTLISQVGFYDSNKTYLGSLQGSGGALSKTYGGSYTNFTVPSGKSIYYMRVTFRNNIIAGIKLDELRVMLNKGNVALDWTPAPEEMATAVKTNEIERTADYSKLAITNLSKNGVVESSSVNATKDGITERVAKVDANGNISYSNRDVKLNSIVTTVADQQYISQQVQGSNIIQSTIATIVPAGANLFKNSDFREVVTGASFNGGGNTAYSHNTYPKEWSGYNGGITNPTNSWHAFLNNTSLNFPVVEFNETDGTRNWKAITTRLDNNKYAKINPNANYMFSVDTYANGTGTKLFGGFYYTKKGGTSQAFHAGQFNIPVTKAGKWERLSAKVPLGSDVDLSKTVIFYIYGFGFTTNSYLYIKNISLTEGDITAGWSLSPEDTATQSQITQLSNSIDLKVTDSDLISRINVRAGNVLIESGTNKLNVTPTTTYIQNGTIKSAMIESLVADKIVTGTLDASKAKIINLDANNITTGNLQSINIVNTISYPEGDKTYTGDMTIAGGQISSYVTAGTDYYKSIFINDRTIRLSNQDASLNMQAGTITFDGTLTGGGQIWYQDNLARLIAGSYNGFALSSYRDGSYSDRLSVGGWPGEALKPFVDIHTRLNMRYNKIENLNGLFMKAAEGKTGAAMYATTDNNLSLGGTWGTVIGHLSSDGTTIYEFLKADQASDRVRFAKNINMQGNTILNQSDERLKHNIYDLERDDLSILKDIRYKNFTFNNQDKETFGFIAQDLQRIMPSLITEETDGYLSYDSMEYTHFIGHALQQHVLSVDSEIDQLKSQIISLQNELARLKGDRK